MERGYLADGWLGFILGAKLFYEFSGKYPFESKIEELLKEIKVFKGRVEDKTVEGRINPENVEQVSSTLSHMIQSGVV